MQLTISDVRLSFWQYLLLSLRFTFQTRPLMLVMLLPVAGTLAALGLSGFSWQSIADLWHGAPFALLFSVALPVLLIWPTWQQYRRSAFLQEAVTYVLDDDEVQVITPSSHTRLDWAAIVKLQHFGHWLLLQTSVQTAFFLDLRQVQAPATPADVLNFFRETT
ncbi:YcxB family protein [Hymenobacter rigui]|uniref:YcxB family protein n=1 Tax=Hymenobacter rigui TaxID=334424 RepID=A0A428KP66_9BACT|nr:YcxB family protein [Hymenobacter rigui]RSK48257.1 YcxB family protein [Hymenobacter rigui]